MNHPVKNSPRSLLTWTTTWILIHSAEHAMHTEPLPLPVCDLFATLYSLQPSFSSCLFCFVLFCFVLFCFVLFFETRSLFWNKVSCSLHWPRTSCVTGMSFNCWFSWLHLLKVEISGLYLHSQLHAMLRIQPEVFCVLGKHSMVSCSPRP